MNLSTWIKSKHVFQILGILSVLFRLLYCSLIDFNMLDSESFVCTFSQLECGPNTRHVNVVDVACMYACRVCLIYPARTFGGPIIFNRRDFCPELTIQKVSRHDGLGTCCPFEKCNWPICMSWSSRMIAWNRGRSLLLLTPKRWTPEVFGLTSRYSTEPSETKQRVIGIIIA